MTKKYHALKNIANIFTGYTFRSRVKPEDQGSLLILQSKDIKGNLNLSDKNLTKILYKTSRTNSFIKNNDIVISSRGSFRSTVIKSTKKILALSSVYILRLTSNQILPEFLSLYLNSKMGQRNLFNMTTGSTIKSILINDLRSLKIPTPSLVKQKELVKLYQSQQNHSNLLKEKLIITSKIFEGALQQL